MKSLYTSYTFSPSARTVTLTGASSSISLENILLVTNVTSASIIYNFADISASGSYNQSSSVLSLGYNTTTMSSVDKLQIFYDDGFHFTTIGGQSSDASPLTGSPIIIGGKVVDSTTYAPTYTTNSVASLAVDKSTGALIVSQGNLSPYADGVGVYGSDGVVWQAATIISASTAKTGNTQVIMVQPVDTSGNVITSSGASNISGNVTASIVGGTLVMTASFDVLTTGGTTYYVTSSFTRSAAPNTASYASGDVVANATASAITNILTNIARITGSSGIIKSVGLVDGANQPVTASYEAYIFNTNRTSEADNAAFSASFTDGERLVAVIPLNNSFVICSGSAGTTVYFANNLTYPFVCSPGTSSLYWNLVVRNAYTPVSSERYTLKLGVSAD